MDFKTFCARAASMERRFMPAMFKMLTGREPDERDIENMAIRGCGDCVACCVYPAIHKDQFTEAGKFLAARDKPFGKMCGFCSGNSCDIYRDRPDVCRGYMCYYRMGLTDTSPMESKVAWSSLPAETRQPAFAIVGQCGDVDDVLDNFDTQNDMLNFLTMRMQGMPVAYIVVRSPEHVARVRMVSGELRCDMIDAAPGVDYVSTDTLRARPFKKLQSVANSEPILLPYTELVPA